MRSGALHTLTMAVLTAAAILSVRDTAVAADASGETAPTGITKLTTTTRQAAVECGNAGASCAIDPYVVCPAVDALFTVRLVTPFSRVASAAFEAKRNGQQLGRMGPGAVNQWGVALAVYPAEGSRTADGISRVEIHRNGSVIEPQWKVIGPATTRIGDGTTRQLSRGFFVFPVEAFQPTSDISVIFFGSVSETVCAIDRARLSSLR